MDLSIIIVNYNVYTDVKLCIESIFETVNNLSYELIVVDNNSIDRSVELVSTEYSNVVFIPLKTNKGFGHANNIGMKTARGKVILLVNPDIVFRDRSVETMFNFLTNEPTAGVVGPLQIKPGSGNEYYYTFFPSLYSRLMQEFRLYMRAPIMKYRFFRFLDENIKAGKPFIVDWVLGSCMMIRSEIVQKTSGFDEAFFLYEEETEWQYRIKQLGWKTYFHPRAVVIHNHHSSASKFGTIFVNYHEFRSRIIFDRKRFSGIKLVIRKLLIDLALLVRLMYFYPKSLFSKDPKRKLNANIDLLKFNNSGKSKILNDRYNFDKKLHLFRS
jgi:GT2 family glycosyltransferase